MTAMFGLLVKYFAAVGLSKLFLRLTEVVVVPNKFIPPPKKHKYINITVK